MISLAHVGMIKFLKLTSISHRGSGWLLRVQLLTQLS